MSDDRWRTATEAIATALGRCMSPLGYSQTLEDCAHAACTLEQELANIKEVARSHSCVDHVAALETENARLRDEVRERTEFICRRCYLRIERGEPPDVEF